MAAMPELVVDVDMAAVSSMLSKLAAHYGEPKKFFAEFSSVFADFYQGQMRAVYASRGGSIGAPWAPLSKLYLEQKRKKGYPAEPHVLTGRTKAELTGDIKLKHGKRDQLQMKLSRYPGFRDRKHQTVHPFYIIASPMFGRLLQRSVPTQGQAADLDKKIQERVNQIDGNLTGWRAG